MIVNFEEYTKELNEYEMENLPKVVDILQKHTKSNPIKQIEITKRYGIPGNRFRKMINFIRRHGILPVVATKYGYYINTDYDELSRMYKSMMQRANSIQMAANGLKQFITAKQEQLF